jgi:hypothetical protein
MLCLYGTVRLVTIEQFWNKIRKHGVADCAGTRKRDYTFFNNCRTIYAAGQSRHRCAKHGGRHLMKHQKPGLEKESEVVVSRGDMPGGSCGESTFISMLCVVLHLFGGNAGATLRVLS